MAWRGDDVDAVELLFTPNVRYKTSPYSEPKRGHDEVKAFWLDDQGETFTVTYDPIAVEDDRAVVALEVRYGDPVRQEYRDLWVLRFADDGRVAEFEEWVDWPNRPYSAGDSSQ